MLLPNSIIGPYTIIRKVGQGGFGTVYLAERRTAITTTKVALKFPHDPSVNIQDIKKEAAVWVTASGHPNILPIIEANIYANQVVIVSEYALDGSLEGWIERQHAVSDVDKVVELMMSILMGLEHLHQQRIIHRDLKPANVLLQGKTPRITDFGLSKILTSKNYAKSSVAGTLAYMAPETFQGRYSEQTDIWAAGVILYQLLTHQLPFPQTDMPSLIGAILSLKPIPLPLSVPQRIHQIIDKALHKDTNQRYRSVIEIIDALQDIKATYAPVDLLEEMRIEVRRSIEVHRAKALLREHLGRKTINMADGPTLYYENGVYCYGGYVRCLLAKEDQGRMLKITVDSKNLPICWIELWQGYYDGKDSAKWATQRRYVTGSGSQPTPNPILTWRITESLYSYYTIYFVSSNKTGEIGHEVISCDIEHI